MNCKYCEDYIRFKKNLIPVSNVKNLRSFHLYCLRCAEESRSKKSSHDRYKHYADVASLELRAEERRLRQKALKTLHVLPDSQKKKLLQTLLPPAPTHKPVIAPKYQWPEVPKSFKK